MKKLFFCFNLLCLISKGQTILECKQRFDTYLNFHQSLDNRVKFTSNTISILNAQGKIQYCFYENELEALNKFCKNSSGANLKKVISKKGSSQLSKSTLDSLKIVVRTNWLENNTSEKPLKDIAIAIDPGHFGTTLKDAEAEQKFLKIVDEKDTTILFESELTFATAYLVKKQLEEKGAKVFLTRSQSNFTSFEMSFMDWLKLNKDEVLNDQLKKGKLKASEFKKLKSCNNHTFFWDFFRDYELQNRAKVINEFHPDVTLIIHYNVDEKNAPWKKTTDKNFTMTFIPGAFTSKDLNKEENLMQFIRLLISDQLNASNLLAKHTVQNFSSILNIPVAKKTDATYLFENCNSSASEGVYSRNLFLCRNVNSILVYGEALYQDNEKELKNLAKKDLELYGIKTNQRIKQVADCYVKAVEDFVKESIKFKK